MTAQQGWARSMPPKLWDVFLERASLDFPKHPLEHIAIGMPVCLGPEQATLLDGIQIGVPKLLDERGLNDAPSSR
jgi:hypothetical protein